MNDSSPMFQKIRTVEVVAHDPRWADAFLVAASIIAETLGQLVVAIHHAGSTAIPTTWAKPILDFVVEVHAIEQVDIYNERMRKHGYEPRGEYGIAGRRFFVKDQGVQRLHNVHIFQTDHPEIARMLTFRDYLRSHTEDAEAYGALKASLARMYPHDIDAYMAGKRALVETIIEKATKWRASQQGDH